MSDLATVALALLGLVELVLRVLALLALAIIVTAATVVTVGLVWCFVEMDLPGDALLRPVLLEIVRERALGRRG